VVEPGYRGIQRDVLTPGTYKINPAQKEVTLVPAVVVPPGSVGVVTRLIGDVGEVTSATLSEIRASTTGPATQAADPARRSPRRRPRSVADPQPLVAGPTQRGICADVLQPGIYYLNPYAVKVSIVPIGYDEITLEHPDKSIRFYSRDGYLVEADFTVVWGRSPADAPHIVANIGLDERTGTDRVRTNVIEPAMKAACQNEGAKYGAKELIQGETRSEFQKALKDSLEAQVTNRNVHVLIALIRNISIKDKTGQDATEGLLGTIQRANIEKERDLTNQQKTLTAAKKAELEQALKLVDVAKETVSSETGVKVANIRADAEKLAAETDAARELAVSSVELEIANLEAKRTQILGKAKADVERMKNEAEAQGAKMLIDAFGSPQAYNQYVFAKGFEPKDLRFIFAGPGTFWTDLKSFQDIGASQVMQQSQQPGPVRDAPRGGP
jgi:regulator of protease activity HflC (stomatin/prohibitin superfamily)